jgi:hypothetical protein
VKNFDELFEFRMYWQDKPGFRVLSRAERSEFPAIIRYSWSNESKTFRSDVSVNHHAGPEDGEINIVETSSVTVEKFHLRFIPKWQQYRFHRDSGSLVISGRSDKMKGNYEVEITPDL